MEKSIVIIEKENLLVGTSDLAKGFGIEHKRIKEMIEKYKIEFESWGEVLGDLRPKPKDPKGGRPLDQLLLNEPQATYLTTLLSNNDKVRKFKHFLTDQFFKQRKLLNDLIIQKQNVAWIEQRESGKIARKQETEHIQMFTDYAKSQGSKNYRHYYSSITNMQHKTLFPVKYAQFKGSGVFRNFLDRAELNIVEISDRVVAQAILEATKLEKPYKEVFEYLKIRTEALAVSLGITPIQKMIGVKNGV